MFKFQNQHLSHVRRRRVVEAQGPAQLQHICESLLRGPEIQEAASPGCRGREHNAPFSELSCCVSSGQSQTWHFRDQADPGGCQGSLKSPLFSYCMLKPTDVPHCSPAWSQVLVHSRASGLCSCTPHFCNPVFQNGSQSGGGPPPQASGSTLSSLILCLWDSGIGRAVPRPASTWAFPASVGSRTCSHSQRILPTQRGDGAPVNLGCNGIPRIELSHQGSDHPCLQDSCLGFCCVITEQLFNLSRLNFLIDKVDFPASFVEDVLSSHLPHVTRLPLLGV